MDRKTRADIGNGCGCALFFIVPVVLAFTDGWDQGGFTFLGGLAIMILIGIGIAYLTGGFDGD